MLKPARNSPSFPLTSRIHPALGLLLLPVLVVLLRGGSGFAYPAAQAPFSDLTLTHYTYTAFLRDQLLGQGSLPLWSHIILSGAPFAANPLSGLWYPFGWPALFLPLPLAFNLLVGLHLGWGALGMFWLLRWQEVKIAPAVFGALAFALMPKLTAHWGAGHLTLLYAVPWTPWLLLAALPTPATGRARLLLPGVVLGVIFLADVRWAAYAGVLWLGWLIWLALQDRQGTKPEGSRPTGTGPGWLAGQAALSLGAAAVLTACLWLPMLEFTALTSRAAMTPAESLELSLTPAGLLGLFFPPLNGGVHETTLYAGGVVLLLSVLALVDLPHRTARFWGLVGGSALIYSLGSSLPGFAALADLPLFNLLRVPPRALFLLGMALAVLAALAIDRWQKIETLPARRRARLALMGVTTAGAGIGALILLWVRPERPSPFSWGTLALLAAGLWLGWGLSAHRSMPVFVAGLFVLLLIDPGVSGQTMLAYRPRAEVFTEKAELAEYLQRQPGQFRIYSPDFSLLQFTAYNHGLEQADGVDPLQLDSYVRFMETATGIPNPGYSVTLPPLENGFEANTRYTPDAHQLGLLNVRYLLSGQPLPETDGLKEIAEIEGVRVYENQLARPRAWLATPGASPDADNFSPVEITVYTPNRIVLTAQGPGTLVLAENLYPGWQVTVDTQPQVLLPAAGTLRTVALGPGEHKVRFDFRPRTVQIGLLISAAGVLSLLAICGWQAAARRSQRIA